MKKISMIFLISFALSACQTTAPRPPVITECGYINEGDPYLHCRFSDGSEHRWRINLTPAESKRWVCTSTGDYARAWEYGQRLERWINNNCSKSPLNENTYPSHMMSIENTQDIFSEVP